MKKRLFPKMKAGSKRVWLAALRSRKYRRAKGKLGSIDGGFCCLGVLCLVKKIDFDECGNFVPSEAAKEMELAHDAMRALACINDGDSRSTWVKGGDFFGVPKPRGYREDKGASFSAIADWIEKYL